MLTALRKETGGHKCELAGGAFLMHPVVQVLAHLDLRPKAEA